MEYVQMTLNDWMSMKGQLELELRNAAASFVKIGYLLRRIEESEGYRNEGYDTLAEWAGDTYGLSKATVSRFMAINARYSIDGYSDQLKQEYALYGSSKLAEMLALPEEDMQMVSPEMKREDIRAIKQFNKEAAKEELPEAEAVPEEESRPAEAGQKTENRPEEKAPEAEAETAGSPEWIRQFFLQNEEIGKELTASDAWKQKDTAKMIEIVNPSGASTFKHKLTFVSMLKEKLMVKVFPAQPVKMEWQEFFEAAGEAIEWAEKRRSQEPTNKVQEPSKPDSAVAPAQQKKAEPAPELEHIMPPPEDPPEKTPEPEAVTAEEPAEAADTEDGEDGKKELERLKQRFIEEINTLRTLLDVGRYLQMQPVVERLEKLRQKMQDIRDEQAIDVEAREKGEAE